MIASAHLACGAAVSIYIQKYLPVSFREILRYIAAFLAGIVSHILMDAWPHWEYFQHGHKLFIILLIEMALVFAGVFSTRMSRMAAGIVFMGMVGGATPDLSIIILKNFFPWNSLLYFNSTIHVFHGFVPIFEANWLFQVILAVLAIVYLKLKLA